MRSRLRTRISQASSLRVELQVASPESELLSPSLMFIFGTRSSSSRVHMALEDLEAVTGLEAMRMPVTHTEMEKTRRRCGELHMTRVRS